jgi:tetratricopeptide (TPR) repeat protein
MKDASRNVLTLCALVLSLFLGGGCATTAQGSAHGAHLAWIEDAPAQAFTAARASGRPIFVDTWAPWCHSCLALKADVLNDAALRKHADAFVWLSLDVERDSAAEFLARYPQPAYPTLWILRSDGRPLLRWVGTLTAEQLVTLLDEARVALTESGAEPRGPATLALEAEAAAAEGRFDDAILLWNEALRVAPGDWSRRSRTANALLFVLMKGDALEAGLELALREVPLAKDGAGRADLVIGGLDCAASLGPEDPRRKAAFETLIPYAEVMREDSRLLADDRSGLFSALVDAREALGDSAKKSETNMQWIDFLESTRRAAKTSEARAVYDSHLMMAYLNASRGEDALAMLTTSERALPGDYNPLARKAHVLLTLGRPEEAKVNAERALVLAYGPRRARIQTTLAKAHERLGALAEARATYIAAIAEVEALPPAQRSARTLADLRKALAALGDASK